MRRSSKLAPATVAATVLAAFMTHGPSAHAADPPKRPLPDYGNRGPRPTTAGDVVKVVVRAAVSPLYFVSEFVIRRPLEAVIPLAERSNIPKELYDFFLFGPDHKAGIVPTFLADFGLRPSVGLYGFWTDAGVEKHDVVVHGSTWGPDWLAGGVTDRVRFSKNSSDNESLTLSGDTRPDRPFYGIGPRSLQANESRYGETRVGLEESIDRHLVPSVLLHASIGGRSLDFTHGQNLYGDPTLDQSIASGALPSPPGYLHDYTLFVSTLRMVVDTRGQKGASGSGVRLELGGQHSADLRGDEPHASWMKYGGSLTGSVDLNGHHRVLSLSAMTEFVDPMTHETTIPFPELVSLGGTAPMRAFLVGRMLDRSAFVTTLEYRWPVWAVLDGTMKAEFGNVFDTHLDDFKPALLRFSGSIGLQTSGVSDNPLQVIFGVGSETFEQGGRIDSFRLFIGTTTNGL
jgi:hypothetical protein